MKDETITAHDTETEHVRKASGGNAPTYPPGPYSIARVNNGVDSFWYIHAAEGVNPIAQVSFCADDLTAARQAEATASLVAASPQMLDTLKVVDQSFAAIGGDDYTGHRLAKQVRDAIRRTGSTPMKEPESAEHADDGETGQLAMAILRILEHYASEEADNFECSDPEIQGRHIFKDLQLLNEWMKRISGMSYF